MHTSQQPKPRPHQHQSAHRAHPVSAPKNDAIAATHSQQMPYETQSPQNNHPGGPPTNRLTIPTTHRAAFTLVEMLIAMTLTLILITAIAQFYAIIGASVKDGRATIEMGGRLRAAVSRLKADLEQLTVTVTPWTDDGAASGYFEYFEGIANDYNANGNFTAAGLPYIDASEDLTDATGTPVNNGNGSLDLLEQGITTTIGDGDDFLGFTIRSPQLPFTGRFNLTLGNNPTIINSQLAEVVWWVGFDDLPNPSTGNRNLRWDFNEPRHLYRRQLLIRPDLGQIGSDYAANQWQQAQDALMNFWQFNDISASIRGEFSNGNLVYRIRANSLIDLSRRENRYGHSPIQVTINNTPPPPNPPFLVDGVTFPHSAVTQSNLSTVTLLLPCFSVKTQGITATTSYALQLGSNNIGEDVILSDLLAFDVQAYDPYARIWPDYPTAVNSALVAVLPSDPGYSAAAIASGSITPPPLLGVGAYVDLNYFRSLPPAAITACNVTSATLPYQSHFGPSPSSPAYLTAAQQTQYWLNFGYTNVLPYMSGATYDTWALSYERDGVDQSGAATTRPDLATNGIDDDSKSGVDDIGERDTAPPYSQPLRGIQVRIRLYEPSTRQLRQATVAMDFVTE